MYNPLPIQANMSNPAETRVLGVLQYFAASAFLLGFFMALPMHKACMPTARQYVEVDEYTAAGNASWCTRVDSIVSAIPEFCVYWPQWIASICVLAINLVRNCQAVPASVHTPSGRFVRLPCAGVWTGISRAGWYCR
jgi:hypothetical protein